MALTDKDLRAIANLIDSALVPLKEEIKGLLPRKEFLSVMDQMMGELQAIRQEQTMSFNRLREHEDRITTLENIHPGGEHKA